MVLSGSWALGAELRCVELACPSSGQGLEQSKIVGQALVHSAEEASLSAAVLEAGQPSEPTQHAQSAAIVPWECQGSW